MHLLAFAREAGGAAAIAPVLKELLSESEKHVVVLAQDPARSVFGRLEIPTVDFPAFDPSVVEELSRKRFGTRQPDVLLTSAASLAALDMTERLLWQWAAQARVPSIAVLDQWQNYELRFSGPEPGERLRYQPDWIAVMDEHAREGLLAEGVPPESIVVTGQPAFDPLLLLRRNYREEDRVTLRRALDIPSGRPLLCFVSEAFADHFGESLGFTEHSVLREMILICQTLAKQTGRGIHLAVKLHPQNDLKEFRWLQNLTLPPHLRITLHAQERPATDWVMASDVVIGMSSILLVESILLGKPTVSFQPGARREEGLIATVLGAIPLLKTREACRATLQALLEEDLFRAAYLRCQQKISTDGGAAKRVRELLHRAAAPKGVSI